MLLSVLLHYNHLLDDLDNSATSKKFYVRPVGMAMKLDGFDGGACFWLVSLVKLLRLDGILMDTKHINFFKFSSNFDTTMDWFPRSIRN